MEIKVTAPLTKEEASKLKSGDIVKITGTIYTARDAAVSYTHLRAHETG